jgi:hypothetical protein
VIHRRLSLLLVTAVVAGGSMLHGAPVAVRYTEGIVHGFVALRTLDGATIADGDLSQTAKGDVVTSHLVFRFKDGSIHDETAVYSQRGAFRMISDHLIQKGPTFPTPLDMTLGSRGDVVVRYTDEAGKAQIASDQLALPADVANGIIMVLLKNTRPGAPPNTVSYVAATPKPRLVKLVATSSGQEPFMTGSGSRTATHYVLKVEIGGIKGMIAPWVGKQPLDSHLWILNGDAPTFVKAEQALYLGGPIWRIEIVSPTWPARSAATR